MSDDPKNEKPEPIILKGHGSPSAEAYGRGKLIFTKRFIKYNRKFWALTWLATIAINVLVTFTINDKYLAVIIATVLDIIPFWLGSQAIVRYVTKEINN